MLEVRNYVDRAAVNRRRWRLFSARRPPSTGSFRPVRPRANTVFEMIIGITFGQVKFLGRSEATKPALSAAEGNLVAASQNRDSSLPFAPLRAGSTVAQNDTGNMWVITNFRNLDIPLQTRYHYFKLGE
jgi:hypothetical protein